MPVADKRVRSRFTFEVLQRIEVNVSSFRFTNRDKLQRRRSDTVALSANGVSRPRQLAIVRLLARQLFAATDCTVTPLRMDGNAPASVGIAFEISDLFGVTILY